MNYIPLFMPELTKILLLTEQTKTLTDNDNFRFITDRNKMKEYHKWCLTDEEYQFEYGF